MKELKVSCEEGEVEEDVEETEVDQGELWAVGANGGGQLGLADNTAGCVDTLWPKRVLLPFKLSPSTSIALSGGSNHTVLCDLSTGQLFACGKNNKGQLGTRDTSQRTCFEAISLSHLSRAQCGDCSQPSDPATTSVAAATVSCGWEHSLVLDTKGIVWTFGDNRYGQLGRQTDPSLLFCSTPRPLSVPTSWKSGVTVSQAVAGIRISLFVLSNGELWGCGDLKSVGLERVSSLDAASTTAFTTVPVASTYTLQRLVPPLDNVIHAACGVSVFSYFNSKVIL
jgi:alpha-tubulin suppressor-like RCC1 family protein